MKILIVDDHPVVRQGIRQILADLPDVESVIEAVNAASALEQVKAHAPELMVLDLNLPDQSGFQVLNEIRQSHPEIKVLILSIQPEKHMASSALKAGAHGYVNKDSAPEELLKAVSSVLRGGSYVSPLEGNWLVSMRGQGQYSPYALISGEQFGLGGVYSVRGTSERALSGDRGLLTTVEASTPEFVPGLRLLGFVDAGWLSNVNPGVSGKVPNDRLASVGLGLRFNSPAGASVSADYGRIVTGSQIPVSINSNAPRRGDQKLHLNLAVRF